MLPKKRRTDATRNGRADNEDESLNRLAREVEEVVEDVDEQPVQEKRKRNRSIHDCTEVARPLDNPEAENPQEIRNNTQYSRNERRVVRRIESTIANQTRAVVKLKMDTIYRCCYYYIRLESCDKYDSEYDRAIIEDLIFEDIRKDYKETDQVCLPFYMNEESRTAFTRIGWSKIRELGKTFHVGVTFGSITTDENCDRPMLMTGTLYHIDEFTTKVDKLMKEKMELQVTKRYKFSLQRLQAVIASGENGIHDLEKETNTKITITNQIGEIIICAKSKDDIDRVVKKIDRTEPRILNVTDPVDHECVYRVFIPEDYIESVVKKLRYRGNIDWIQNQTDATCIFDGCNTVICSGTYEQAQHAHYLINIEIGVTNSRCSYKHIHASN